MILLSIQKPVGRFLLSFLLQAYLSFHLLSDLYFEHTQGLLDSYAAAFVEQYLEEAVQMFEDPAICSDTKLVL